MINTCSLCKRKVETESDLELSHDIPRWMGGTDKDGRHYLCHECHKNYEKKILQECILLIPDFPILDSETLNKIFWNELKNQPAEMKAKFRLIAGKVKEETYGNTKQTTAERD